MTTRKQEWHGNRVMPASRHALLLDTASKARLASDTVACRGMFMLPCMCSTCLKKSALLMRGSEEDLPCWKLPQLLKPYQF
eukprot:6214411-Pleurochrysis_carterae.AAC.2